jgi:hypothetical protein
MTGERPVSDDLFLKFDYDERDVLHGMRLRLAGRSTRGLVAVGLAAVAFAVTWETRVDRAWEVAAGVLGLVLGVVLVATLRRAPPSMARVPLDRPRAGVPEPEGFRDTTLSLDASATGVVLTVGGRVATLPWSRFASIASDDRTYLLLLEGGGFVVIPRRAFRSPRRDAEFRALFDRFLRESRPAAGLDASGDADRVADGVDDRDSAASAEEGDRVEVAEAAVTDAPIASSASHGERPIVGRNDPCPCGSGKKHKKCCLLTEGGPA